MVMLSGEQRTRGQAQMSTTPVVVAGRAGGPLAPWVPGFAEWLGGRGFAPETVAGYLRWLGWLSRWLAGRGLAGYREHMARRDLAPGTVAARLRVAGMFLDGLGGDAAADGLEDLTPRL